MADTLVSTLNLYGDRGLYGPYWVSKDRGVIITVILADIDIFSTTNGGATWTNEFVSGGFVTNQVGHIACWFDKDTPGDSGSKIHVVSMPYHSTATIPIWYNTFDVSTFTAGTKREIVSVLGDANGWSRAAITKSISGHIHVVYCSYTDQIGHYCSIDNGVNWISKTALGYTDSYDKSKLFPSPDDDDDIVELIWIDTLHTVKSNVYDYSANSVSAGATITNIDWGGSYKHPLGASIRLSDNHVIMALHSNDDYSGDDLMTYDWDISGTPSYTQKTNVFTNVAESRIATVVVNQQNNDIYVAYIKGGTWGSLTDVWFSKSTDGGVTWGTHVKYNVTQDDIRNVHCGNIYDCGGRVQWIWYESDLHEIWVNLDNDIEIGEKTGTNSFVNIGDDFKEIESMQINIGDDWKDVTSAYINIGDSWKQIF